VPCSPSCCKIPSPTGLTPNCSQSERQCRWRTATHDEAIKRAHTEYIAATIAGAGPADPPNSSHFAFLRDATLFNVTLLHFLADR